MSALSTDLYALGVKRAAGRETVLSVPACDVCGSTSAHPWFDLAGTSRQLVRCCDCGLGVLFPFPDGDEIRGFYPDEYYGDSGRKFAKQIEWLVRLVGERRAHFLARHLPPGGRVLDVGCGRGVTLRGMAEAGYETHGFEISREAVQGIDPRVQVRVANTLQEAGYEAAYFDEIVIWHVLEHVTQPAAVIAEAARLLKPGGVLIVAVPNFSSLQARLTGPAWFHLDLPRHLYHFPLRALRQLLTNQGLVCRRSHHFSLRQNPFGWVQSWQNMCWWLPRNGLYRLMQRRKKREQLPFTRSQRLQLRAFLWLMAPVALALSVVAAALRSGATVHVVARKPA